MQRTRGNRKGGEEGEEGGEGVDVKWRNELLVIFHYDELSQNWNNEGKNGMDLLPLTTPNNRHFGFERI